MNNELEPSTPASTPSFEESMQELEKIVDALEGGNVPLGESLQLVQRGRELSEACAQLLSEAELTLSQLVATPEGELVEEELDWNEEN
jgi:exodeoxyribonuclease VII small subunit